MRFTKFLRPENFSKQIFLKFPCLDIEGCTIHSPNGVGSVVSKCLPPVTVSTLMEGVDGQLETRQGILDQDDKLLIHESSGRLN